MTQDYQQFWYFQPVKYLKQPTTQIETLNLSREELHYWQNKKALQDIFYSEETNLMVIKTPKEVINVQNIHSLKESIYTLLRVTNKKNPDWELLAKEFNDPITFYKSVFQSLVIRDVKFSIKEIKDDNSHEINLYANETNIASITVESKCNVLYYQHYIERIKRDAVILIEDQLEKEFDIDG